MVIDTSALVAILFAEPEASRMVQAIAASGTRIVGAPTLVEVSAVLIARKGGGGEVALDALIERLDLQVIEFSPVAARLARLGYARFGRGVGSPPVLNLGDCFSYGIAMALGEPLLFKGEDFQGTDVEVAAH